LSFALCLASAAALFTVETACSGFSVPAIFMSVMVGSSGGIPDSTLVLIPSLKASLSVTGSVFSVSSKAMVSDSLYESGTG